MNIYIYIFEWFWTTVMETILNESKKWNLIFNQQFELFFAWLVISLNCLSFMLVLFHSQAAADTNGAWSEDDRKVGPSLLLMFWVNSLVILSNFFFNFIWHGLTLVEKRIENGHKIA